MSLEDISVECLVIVDDGAASPCETSAPVHDTVGTFRETVYNGSSWLVWSSKGGSVVESRNSLAPLTTSHIASSEEHSSVGFLDSTSVPAGGSIIPHDSVGVVHVLPFLVLVSGEANRVVLCALVLEPGVVKDSLVSLLLLEVAVVWCLTLRTNRSSLVIKHLPALLDVFEVLDFCGIEYVVRELSIPVVLLILVDVAIEHQISGEDLGLELISAVSH